MRELYVEDLASHGGPESCVGCSRGRRRSVDRGRAGGAIEPRNSLVRGADEFPNIGRQHRWRRYRLSLAGPARSEIPGTYDRLHAREPGGLVVALLVVVMPRPGWFAGWHTRGWSGREGNA